ncbi:helix-turn-helix domain-containing protein [Micromonospora sp. A3M-1-15]|uniref:AfsR/SARP family transcriptional regulator n=1 Tax=Micromonospora sp. A3M-1-15 TaxID=2962035 RepID=UPI0020B7CBB2|nr:helix-turn-helix domain-containing protein [Micromonospora sp. A3M-1-15]MCP3786719.1 helix-turn-helix domain-containing protein [Micromonospora sp. A3M-1-15]
MRGYRIGILGRIELDVDGAAVSLAPLERALVASLAAHHGRIVSVDRLIDGLWPTDPPTGPRNRVQAIVASVRRAAAPELILGCRVLLGTVLLAAAVGKVSGRDAYREFTRSVRDMGYRPARRGRRRSAHRCAGRHDGRAALPVRGVQPNLTSSVIRRHGMSDGLPRIPSWPHRVVPVGPEDVPPCADSPSGAPIVTRRSLAEGHKPTEGVPAGPRPEFSPSPDHFLQPGRARMLGDYGALT